MKASKLSSVTWRKSSHSGDEGGNCIELADLGMAWRKSSHSGGDGGQCIELADLDSAIGIRDSKNSDGPALVFRRREFGVLVARVKSGDLG